MVAGKTKRQFTRASLYIVIILLCLIFFYPAFVVFANSLRSYSSTSTLFFNGFHWKNYIWAVTMIPFGQYLMHSLAIAGISVTGTTLMSAIVGFGFARLYGPGKNVLFVIILATMMLPGIVTQVPQFLIYHRIGFINTYWPWVVGAIGGSPFFIFLYKQFFSNIPKEMEEAARIDGCSTFGIFSRIFIPVSVPVITTVAVMTFQGAWGDAMSPFMYLSSNMWPLATALISATYTLNGNANVVLYPVLEAAAIIFAIPSIITFFVGQRYLVEGIVTTGLKG